jgi:hypothetical protein
LLHGHEILERFLPDVVESVIDNALFWPALMLIEVGLKLRFGLVGVN